MRSGRYLFLNAVANQLRYQNNHTHYFSCVLLHLFDQASQEIVQEQITRDLPFPPALRVTAAQSSALRHPMAYSGTREGVRNVLLLLQACCSSGS